MDERVMEFRVGASFLGALIFAGILVFLFGKMPTFIRHYEIRAHFEDVGGVSSGAPVRINGVLIGRVTDIRLTHYDESVLLTMEIQSDITIYKNEVPTITRDIMGNTAVVFMASTLKRGRGEPVKPGEELAGRYSSDPTGLKRELQGPIDTVSNTGVALTKASEQLNAAAKRVELILNDKAQRDISNILNAAAQSLKGIQKVMGNEENQRKLSEALSRLPETFDNMNHTFASTDAALRKLTTPSGPDRKTPVDRMVNTIEMAQRSMRQFSEPSEPGQPPPVEQIAKAVENFNEVTHMLRDILGRVENGDGSLGAMVNDRQLYDRLNKAARNIEQLSRELRPIVEDAGVFMDKAARHPGGIIRDAIRPGVGIK
jgi:phospholipid/cholesterol/gamma-HCH transport system substrate-binding protein